METHVIGWQGNNFIVNILGSYNHSAIIVEPTSVRFTDKKCQTKRQSVQIVRVVGKVCESNGKRDTLW